ncbi:MAG: hypothetical protein AB8C02_17205 [Halioglobus sp.]
MLKTTVKLFAVSLAVLFACAALALAWFTRNTSGPVPSEATPAKRASVQTFIGEPWVAQPLPSRIVAEHPFLAEAGNNSMHNDSYQSDAYAWSGPLGIAPKVDSAWFHPIVGSCVASVTDPQGRLVSTCVTPFGVTLIARDPETLAILARHKITYWLPTRTQFGGGVYFHLDHQGRVLLASNTPAIELWELEGGEDSLRWKLAQAIPIGDALDASGHSDHRVIDVMPDWQGNYWFITRSGLVGMSDRGGNNVTVQALPGEGIDNALAISASGVFVASNHALYKFSAASDGTISTDWRQTYDRGPAPKPGTMGHGTGTTPTLIGEDYVAITDNADGRINVLVYLQTSTTAQNQPICKVPVFPPDKGTSENSMVALASSLIVENNFGYQGPFEDIDAEPGLARINVLGAKEGCEIAWENNTISAPSSVPKASLANGLIYIYTRDSSNPSDLHAWYFTAVDARTGKLAFKVLTGIGRKFNNHYGSISITPSGDALVGVMGGIVRVRDGSSG